MSYQSAAAPATPVSQGMKVLRNGELIRVPPSFEARSIDFGTGPVPASVIPWGDLATAYWQTGIPNISVYSRRRVSKATDLIPPIIQTVMKSGALQRL
jgi:short subunit dehydrogenase-like uncharacterized protein